MITNGLVGGMAYSDVIVLKALQRLIRLHGSDTVLSYARIGEAAGTPLNTTIRALKRLQTQQRIVPERTPVGYRYRITDEQHTT